MASWTKLQDGKWAVRITTDEGITPRAGSTVTVRKADGTHQSVTLERVAKWKNGGGWFGFPVEQARTTRQSGGGRYHREGDSDLKPVRGYSKCSYLGRMCDQCQFDEFDGF